jgi:hypothetical protein
MELPMEELNRDARERFEKENAAWGRLTHEERVAWTRALSKYPPTKLNTIAGFALNACKRDQTPVLFDAWVKEALYWDARGFTPAQWLSMRRSA